MTGNYDLFDLNAPPGNRESTENTNDTGNIYSPLARQREAERQQCAMYSAYQEAIIKSEILRNEITKGIRAGQEPCNLLLKAVECISLITGDEVFLKLNRETMKMKYGSGEIYAE